MSPIDIIIKNLDYTLESKPFQFPNSEAFYTFLDHFVEPEPTATPSKDQRPFYRITSDNALEWAHALETAWVRLQSEVLERLVNDQKIDEHQDDVLVVDVNNTKISYRVKKISPTNRSVVTISLLMAILDNFLCPVLQHFASTPNVSKALGEAGKMEGPSF